MRVGCCSVGHQKVKPSSSSFMSRLSTRRKDNSMGHCSNINALASPLIGRRLGQPGPAASSTLLGLGAAPAGIVAATGGQDVSDLESVNDADR